jgi:hypothetical protein
MNEGTGGIRISRPREEFEARVLDDLRQRLTANPDVAFVHLVDVEVEGVAEPPCPTLFVWLVPQAVGSLRLALNVLTEAVAAVIPNDRFLDVLILNSAPELLLEVERTGCLLIERDPEERRRAVDAASLSGGPQPRPPKRGWWPF